ncbi:hypothetical protein A2781_04230 [Candidatus Gottesmanbacteria bacterium RIFCSPHIGHO2_01_FULL_42_27]|uniref:Uncharacterized protein n=2 Tax=Candidatus Gottesmaniibacteriota TaxID=1752720 RepID=A0A1F6BGD6_9BACT|nr:MAG: hypothetical protein UV09_C0017G0024 [Candidatus Gottesmanbacteria bacterium GW2011_GWA2_42_18]OGG11046.1 MAG: hypothetical protein A2781_04230 [Candidatus Gottesmanbacteria bacterium RIFCSPHIGHO2_01_FULL_42_27]OGG19752.1 MAG: hypothetical protein A3E72_03815 [Candidatus Gottesmanbacteria bacterium RIFCSPHIGHO2_12_FULL_43_26]OGG35991.1 MAG: hypothetical protein A2968_03730 [Candidatus Gottesmanbacteria bacterium RIFCSPLOWO2_01_FULL_42_22]
MDKLKKKISLILILAVFLGNILSPFAVVAQEGPSGPSAPSAPAGPGSPPSAPEGPSGPAIGPSAPSGPAGPGSPPPRPSGPSGPAIGPSALSGPSGPGTPPPLPDYNQPAPERTPFPTVVDLQNPDPLNTGNNFGDQFNASTGDGTNGLTSGSDPLYQGGSVNDPLNIYTGPNSYNYGAEIIDKKLEIMNQNLAKMQNKIDAMTSTGFNYANLNTLDGQVFSGNTQAALNLLNKLNSNISGIGGFSVMNIYDNYLGDIVLNFTDGNPANAFSQASQTVSENSLTGPLSTNIADSQSSFTIKEATGNDAKIENDINLSAITGNNTASMNTGNGEIESGDASAVANIINMVNTNLNVANWLIGVINIYGALLGDIILPQEANSGTLNGSNTSSGGVIVGNQNTGPGSDNYASYTSNTTAEFNTVNNADIESSLDVSANTGNNNASVNTGGGFVQTGSSDAAISNSTIANTTTVSEDDTVWMIIVNEAGKWVGHILGSPWGSTSASNSLPVTTETGGFGNQNYSVYSGNEATGPLSQNIATIASNTEESYITENNAAITNNITANADTGNNQAMYNTGAGVISTGDADVALNLVNMANTNVVAKKFVAILVNVIGEFMGDVIPTGYTDNTAQTGNNSHMGGTPDPLPTLKPLPTLPALPGLQTPSFEVNTEYNYSLYPQNQEYYNVYPAVNQGGNNYPDEYISSVNKVNNQRYRTYILRNYLATAPSPTDTVGNQQTRVLRRGLFLSNNFAKATQATFPGILLGGLSLRVTSSWLAVLPLALFMLYWRRRRRYNIDFTVYLNNILEIIL